MNEYLGKVHGLLGLPSYNIFVNYANIVSCSSFTRSVPNRTLSPFSLVHSNMWDSSFITSILGFPYFVTSVDDYSQHTRLFLMKIILSCFPYFNLFIMKLKISLVFLFVIFRIDNTCEYLCHSF